MARGGNGQGNGKPVLTGGDADDQLGPDDTVARINGGDGDDTIAVGESATRINAGDGDDVISSGVGDDTIHGNDGYDTVVFTDSILSLWNGTSGTWSQGKGNSWTVTTSLGTDTLKHVEALAFSDYTLHLDGINNDPFAQDDDAGETAENAVLTIDGASLLANDHEFDGESLTITSVTASGSGALVTLNSDGTISYDANGAYDHLNDGESATDSFTYTTSDGNGGTATATVTVTINGVGSPCETGSYFLSQVRVGGAGDDHLCFDASVSILYSSMDGNEGDDRLSMIGGGHVVGNRMDGDEGADQLTMQATGGLISNNLFAGDGDDEVALTSHWYANGNLVQAGSGEDVVTFVSTGQSAARNWTYYTTLEGGDGNDSLDLCHENASGGHLSDAFFGNILRGGDGDDQLSMSAEVDGDDVPLLGGGGLYGGAGADNLSFEVSAHSAGTVLLANASLDGGADDDVISMTVSISSDLTGLNDARAHGNLLRGGDGDDLVSYTAAGGYSRNIVLRGDGGNDTLILDDLGVGRLNSIAMLGDDGNDVIINNASSLVSGSVNSHGGAGDDVFHTGNGIDRVWTGAGNDTVIHDAGDDTDYVLDFVAGSGDLIDMTGHGVSSLIVEQYGADTWLMADLGGQAVVLVNVDMTDLTQGVDYIF